MKWGHFGVFYNIYLVKVTGWGVVTSMGFYQMAISNIDFAPALFILHAKEGLAKPSGSRRRTSARGLRRRFTKLEKGVPKPGKAGFYTQLFFCFVISIREKWAGSTDWSSENSSWEQSQFTLADEAAANINKEKTSEVVALLTRIVLKRSSSEAWGLWVKNIYRPPYELAHQYRPHSCWELLKSGKFSCTQVSCWHHVASLQTGWIPPEQIQKLVLKEKLHAIRHLRKQFIWIRYTRAWPGEINISLNHYRNNTEAVETLGWLLVRYVHPFIILVLLKELVFIKRQYLFYKTMKIEWWRIY